MVIKNINHIETKETLGHIQNKTYMSYVTMFLCGSKIISKNLHELAKKYQLKLLLRQALLHRAKNWKENAKHLRLEKLFAPRQA